MNKHRRQSIRLRVSARPREKGVYRRTRRLPLKIILSSLLLVFLVAGALGVAAITFLHSRNERAGHGAHMPVATASATASPLIVGSQNPVSITTNPPVPSPAVPDPSPISTPAVAAQPSLPVPVTTPAPVSTPVPQSSPIADEDRAHDAKSPSEALRKNAEQARREAERKRAHLEAMYKKHLISEDAYKKGQDEYQEAILKYRSTVGGPGTTNE